MKGIVLVVLVMVVGLLSFSSCSNKKVKPFESKIEFITGDCFDNNLQHEIHSEMKKLGWVYYDDVENSIVDGIIINFELPYYLKFIKQNSTNKSDDSIKLRRWVIEINDNKLIARNEWSEKLDIFYNSSYYIKEYNTLSTDKNDTSFWNVIDMLRKYCDVRDTSYIKKSLLSQTIDNK